MSRADTQPYPSLPELTDDQRIARAHDMFVRLQSRRSCREFANTPVPTDIIANAIRAAGTAPSGANHQPWHFAAISCLETKRAIRLAAEEEERRFYGTGGSKPKASDEWLAALDPLGTDDSKPFLKSAPWLIVCFAQRKGGIAEDGETQNYYVNESVGIACGMLIATLHEAGLATLTHTPSPMGFLREICGRPEWEKPLMIVVVGHPAESATVPDHALQKKPLSQIASWL